mmetsp:Transcript_127319/g.407264  ORF Transcript_127319/g.407264 Transcript_127319/m.407264 type:complete len:333 (-) Transcript_127319:1798-2796(-)
MRMARNHLHQLVADVTEQNQLLIRDRPEGPQHIFKIHASCSPDSQSIVDGGEEIAMPAWCARTTDHALAAEIQAARKCGPITPVGERIVLAAAKGELHRLLHAREHVQYRGRAPQEGKQACRLRLQLRPLQQSLGLQVEDRQPGPGERREGRHDEGRARLPLAGCEEGQSVRQQSGVGCPEALRRDPARQALGKRALSQALPVFGRLRRPRSKTPADVPEHLEDRPARTDHSAPTQSPEQLPIHRKCICHGLHVEFAIFAEQPANTQRRLPERALLSFAVHGGLALQRRRHRLGNAAADIAAAGAAAAGDIGRRRGRHRPNFWCSFRHLWRC